MDDKRPKTHLESLSFAHLNPLETASAVTYAIATPYDTTTAKAGISGLS